MTHKTIVVIPAYNAEKTLKKTIENLPLTLISEIIIVDDCSPDRTYEEAQVIKENLSHNQGNHPEITIIKHTHNTGYGGNQKTCYDTALAHGGDVIIMIHGDFQYDPTAVKILKEFLENRNFDCMLGSRIRSKKEALHAGMPYYKYIANRFLSSLENFITGRVLTDWHTGMRGYTRHTLESIPYHTFSNDFIFDTQMLLTLIKKKYSIGEIPIPVRYFKEASSINFKRSVIYGLLTLKELIRFIVK